MTDVVNRRAVFLVSVLLLASMSATVHAEDKSKTLSPCAEVVAAPECPATIILRTFRSSELGWVPGNDVSREFAALARRWRPGDRLILEGRFLIRGSDHQLPENFTLTATNGGGFDVIDAMINNMPLIRLGRSTTIANVTITVSNAPDTGTEAVNPVRGVDYLNKSILASFGADDVTIVSSAFEGNVSMFLDVRTGDRMRIEDTHFEGGMYQVRLMGDVTNVHIEGSVFEDAVGDGIKTERLSGEGPKDVTILDSAFIGNNRDGIDTAGGLQDALISGTVFRDNGVSGLDLKTMIEGPDDYSTGHVNANIRVEHSAFVDSRNAIVVTMLDRAGHLTASNANAYMPHNITVVDTIFEKTSDHNEEMRAFLVKDGYNITWNNVQMLGGIHDEVRIMNAEAPDGWSAYNVGGTNVEWGEGEDGAWLSEFVGMGELTYRARQVGSWLRKKGLESERGQSVGGRIQ